MLSASPRARKNEAPTENSVSASDSPSKGFRLANDPSAFRARELANPENHRALRPVEPEPGGGTCNKPN